MSRLIVCLLFLITAFSSGCSKELSDEEADMGSISLSFSSVVKTLPLTSGREYTNSWGEKYSVTTFKYYLHDIAFVNANGVTYPASTEYYLVDEAKPDSKTIILRAPAAEKAERHVQKI